MDQPNSRPTKPWERVTTSGTANGADVPLVSGMSSSHQTSTPSGHQQWNMNTGPSSSRTASRPPPVPPRNYDTAIATTASRSPYPIMGGYGGGATAYGSAYGYNPLYGMSGYGGYGSSYGMAYGGGYGGAYGGGYGAYGRYGMGSSAGTQAPGQEGNDFVRVAEESSQQAFQSIESIVHAFGSVSMMLESTYFAVYSSFRAVLGVADHFSRLRAHLGAILGSLALLKTLRWFLRRIGYLLGLVAAHPNAEDAWNEAITRPMASGAADDLAELLTGRGSSSSGGRSSWPILIFFSVVLGTPYVIWRLLASIGHSSVSASATSSSSPSNRRTSWASGEGEHFTAVARYPFEAAPGRRELSIREGETIRIAPRDQQPRMQNWLIAARTINQSSLQGGGREGDNRGNSSIQIGLVPFNYIEITGKISAHETSGTTDKTTASNDPVKNVQDD